MGRDVRFGSGIQILMGMDVCIDLRDCACGLRIKKVIMFLVVKSTFFSGMPAS